MVRLDKYLKLSRLMKRRTVAQEMITIGAVRLNQKTVKPSSDVSEGDIIEIAYPRRVLVVRVLIDQEALLKRNLAPYEVVEERYVDGEERPW
ncbi:MAG: RNA-binding S4 domain-containing protein [Synergistaceae bacterium]|jgi:ribosomal 50S subunit-recycling heat shock protein|nr:RNA-binding S4 domain-containing protein [Synergistaceae bacterium]